MDIVGSVRMVLAENTGPVFSARDPVPLNEKRAPLTRDQIRRYNEARMRYLIALNKKERVDAASEQLDRNYEMVHELRENSERNKEIESVSLLSPTAAKLLYPDHTVNTGKERVVDEKSVLKEQISAAQMLADGAEPRKMDHVNIDIDTMIEQTRELLFNAIEELKAARAEFHGIINRSLEGVEDFITKRKELFDTWQEFYNSFARAQEEMNREPVIVAINQIGLEIQEKYHQLSKIKRQCDEKEMELYTSLPEHPPEIVQSLHKEIDFYSLYLSHLVSICKKILSERSIQQQDTDPLEELELSIAESNK